MLLASACATVIVSPEPFHCPPLTEDILDEYEVLMGLDLTPELRAWVREADRACRANAALIKEDS